MATKADKAKWDKLHADLEKAYAAKDDYEIQLGAKYGHHFQLPWLGTGERKKLEQLRDRTGKLRDKIIDLLVAISPRGERWLSGAPVWWLARTLTWEDATRPKDEPLSIVVPGSYGNRDGTVTERRAPARVRSTRATENRKMADDKETPIANAGEFEHDKTLFEFQFGAYADTKVYVWADNDEDAFEIAVEWADENAKGVFTTVTEDDLKEAAEDLGVEWQSHWPDWDDPKFEKVAQAAEADLTVIGHTTLDSGTHIHSDEWHFHEVTDDDELKDVAIESFEEDGSDMLDINYESEGPDKDEPTNKLEVTRDGGFIDITEWTDVYAANGEPESEGDILRQDTRVDIYELLDPKGKHRGSYSGDKKDVDLGDVLLMDQRKQEKAVVAAAIAWMAYYGGEESHVDYVGA